MGKFNFANILKCIAFTALSTGCVSVHLESRKPVRSHDIELTAPPTPFESRPSDNLDRMWLNKKNGNVISLMSDCHNPVDPSLQNLQQGILSQIENVTFMETRAVEFNERAGLHTLASGTVDGIKSQMEFVIFKKNHCLYILSYIGVATRFGEDQKTFQKFIKEFHVP